MSESTRHTNISSTGSVTIRRPPSLLLMKMTLRASEATLALALTKLNKLSAASTDWLNRLKASPVEFGEPSFTNEADADPVAQVQARARRMMQQNAPKQPSKSGKCEVCRVVTALWDIESMSAEEILVFVDRLQFELSSEAESNESAENPSWVSQEEQFANFISSMQAPPLPDDRPQFLYISRLTVEEREKALAKALGFAYAKAETLARAAGWKLGPLSMLSEQSGDYSLGRTDRMMNRQRCGAMLAGSSYDLKENDMVSDNPRSMEFVVVVHTHHTLEPVE